MERKEKKKNNHASPDQTFLSCTCCCEGMQLASSFLALLCGLLIVCAASANSPSDLADVATAPRMHVGVVSIPLYGHFMPLKAAGEALLAKGHAVTLFVENPSWCISALPQQFACVTIPKSNTFTPEFFVNMSAHPKVGDSFLQIFEEMFRHHSEQLGLLVDIVSKIHESTPFSLMLVDLSSFVGYGVADKLHLPYASMFPLTMHMVVGPATYLPAIGTSLPSNGRMTTGQRLLNYLLKVAIVAKSGDILGEVNAVRARHGVEPMKHAMQLAGMEGLIFSPTIWGYDIPQPLCPNIFGVGVLSPTHDHTPLERELNEFLATCSSTIYVNFGTLAVLHDRTFKALFDGLLLTEFCIVWKIRESARMDSVREEIARRGASGRFYLSFRFANPVAIMQHAATRAFVSHCGDTSVLEAIESNLPIAGIPIFADQADVCLRVDESKIGVYVGHKLEFTAERLASVLSLLVQSSAEYRQTLKRMKEVSDFLGGPAKVAEVIETRYYNGLLQGSDLLERCHVLDDHLVAVEGSSWRICQFDLTLGYLLGLMMSLWIAQKIFLRCICRHGPKRVERNERRQGTK